MSTRTQQWKGRLKQAAGALTGNRRLEREGRTDRGTADARAQIDKTAGKLEELVDKAGKSVGSALGTAKNKRQRK